MTKKDIPRAINSVLSGEKTLHAAAKDLGIASANLRYWIMKNPETAAAYAKAQAADPRRKAPKTARLHVEDLVNHPAVQAVVTDGWTYAKAAEEYGVNLMTLHGWVKKLFPEGINRKPGPRSFDMPLSPSMEMPKPQEAEPAAETGTHAVVDVLIASVQAAATILGLTYHQVLAKLLEQAPTNPQQTRQQPAQPTT